METRFVLNGTEHTELCFLDKAGRVLPDWQVMPDSPIAHGCRSRLSNAFGIVGHVAVHVMPDDDPPCLCGLIQPTRWISTPGGLSLP